MKTSGLMKLCAVAVMVAACGGTQPTQPNQPAESVATVVVGANSVKAVPAPAMPGVNVPSIKVDTVGYVTDWKKIVIFNVDPAGSVVVDSNGGIVLTITDDKIKNYGIDEASKDPVWQVDISDIRTPGVYVVKAANASSSPWLQSDPFVVGDYKTVYYDNAVVAGIKSFYFQRTRTALVEPWAVWKGYKYIRPGVSHVGDDVGWDWTYFPEKKSKWQTNPDKQWWPGEQIKKGWFDAGNFDMYIPSTGPSTQVLLHAYEWAPEMFKDGDQNIPESGNGVPDILDESTWGLDWIMSMQQKDGAFRHSEAVEKWDGRGPADQDMSVRWIRGISSSSTAKAVSVLAMASQIYKKFPVYAQIAAQYEQAAKMGWAWLQANPKDHPCDGKTSPQPLWDDGKDGKGDVPARFAAAAEMWLRFRDASALASVKTLMEHPLIKENIDEGIFRGSWVNISRYGLISLAQDAGTPADVRDEAKRRIVQVATTALPRVEVDGYRTCDEVYDYYWGHNANLAEKVHVFAAAYRLTNDMKFMNAARDAWHWINGRNPNGYSMTTGVGSRPPTRFYHMEWGPYQEEQEMKSRPFPPPPGFLVSGPNAGNNGFLAPGAPAKAILWDNPEPTRNGTPPHAMWHWAQTSLWDGNFKPEDDFSEGWWGVVECDLIYSSDYVLAGIAVK